MYTSIYKRSRDVTYNNKASNLFHYMIKDNNAKEREQLGWTACSTEYQDKVYLKEKDFDNVRR